MTLNVGATCTVSSVLATMLLMLVVLPTCQSMMRLVSVLPLVGSPVDGVKL